VPEQLTTAQVAQRLGVKSETVYAYVSRGLLHRTRGPGGRGSLFDAVEVERLAARRSGRRGGPGPQVRTALTLIRDGRLYYRGMDATVLARTDAFEAVATLLWSGESDPDARFEAPDDLVAQARAAAAALPDRARLTDRLRVIVTAAACADPRRFDTASVAATAATVLAAMVDALPLRGPEPPGGSLLAARLWPRLSDQPPRPEAVAALNAALVLLADHDLAASTVAARVAASTRADPYAVVAAGLAAFDGPLHGAAASHAHRLLADALGGDPVAVYTERLRTEGRVPGFLPHVHRLYPHGDVRAATLLGLLPEASTVRAAVDGLAAAAGPDAHPSIELALAAFAHAAGMGPDAGEAIFALARTAGWIAHAAEEYDEPGLRFRFTGSYAGPPPG
jgi:citrate synthase